VQAAKKAVYGAVDIDAIAGPSEVVVIADTSAAPAYVAADLMAQAEHGSGDECAVLLTPSRRLAAAVQAEIEVQLVALPRRQDIARVCNAAAHSSSSATSRRRWRWRTISRRSTWN